MYNKKKLNQLCNKEINIIFSEKGYGKRFHESQQFKKLKYYKKQYKNIIDRINNDLDEFNDELNTFIFLEKDFKEHSIHYYQLECLVEYLKQLKGDE